MDFRKLCLRVSSVEPFQQAEAKALSLGYSWLEGAREEALASMEKSVEESARWTGRSVMSDSFFLVMEETWKMRLQKSWNVPPKGYREIGVSYSPVSEHDWRLIQRRLATSRNYEQKTCFATDEIQISFGRADVLETRWDGTLVEYEVKVSKSDFESEMCVIRRLLSGEKAPGGDSESKTVKHSAYLSPPKKETRPGVARIIPKYFSFVVPPFLEKHAKESLKGSPYWLVVAEDCWKARDGLTHYRFVSAKPARKVPWHDEPCALGFKTLMLAFGNRAKNRRNELWK